LSVPESAFPLLLRRIAARLRITRYRLAELTVTRFLIALIKEVGRDDVSNMAATISYYAFLSLFPLILALIAIFGLILPSQSVQQQILNFFSQYFPGSMTILQNNIDDIIRFRGTLGVVGILGLLWSSTGMFGVVSRGINRAWDIQYQHPFYIKKPREIAMVLGSGILLLLSLGASALFSLLGSQGIPLSGALIHLATIIVAFLFSLLIFSLVYKAMPITFVSWKFVWPGAVLATLLFESGKTLFVFYLNHYNNYDRIYGSVASVIVMLVWTYFSAYILLLGAEFSSMLHRFKRDGTAPEDITSSKNQV
jgi:membrane protein